MIVDDTPQVPGGRFIGPAALYEIAKAEFEAAAAEPYSRPSDRPLEAGAALVYAPGRVQVFDIEAGQHAQYSGPRRKTVIPADVAALVAKLQQTYGHLGGVAKGPAAPWWPENPAAGSTRDTR